MNLFIMNPSERIPHWREFRDQIKDMDELEQLMQVARLIGQAPSVNFKMNQDKPETWLTPWELLNEAEFDDVSKAYFAEQTLILCGWEPERFEIIGLRNNIESFQTVILRVDQRYVLNYYHNQVNIFDNDCANVVLLFNYSYRNNKRILER